MRPAAKPRRPRLITPGERAHALLITPSERDRSSCCHSERSEDRFLSARFLRGESWLSSNPAESHETHRKTPQAALSESAFRFR